jgi:hypothetical protein
MVRSVNLNPVKGLNPTVHFASNSNNPDLKKEDKKSKSNQGAPDQRGGSEEYPYTEFLDTEFLDPNYRNNRNPAPQNTNTSNPPQNPSGNNAANNSSNWLPPGVPSDSELERLFNMEPNPLLNGEMDVWPFSELVEAVENLIPDYVEGKIELAVRYTHGVKGASKDRTRAEKWYRSAAMQGDARAQYYLAIFLTNEFPRVHPWYKALFESFTSVPIPTVYEKEAAVWFYLASQHKQRRVAEVDMAEKSYREATRNFSRRNLAWVEKEARRIQQEINESMG